MKSKFEFTVVSSSQIWSLSRYFLWSYVFVIGKEDSVIVGVGGLSGQMLNLLHQELPNLQYINFDLPHVIENMKPIENIKMVGSDMFKVDTPPECGVIFTKNVLHDWSNENV